MLWWTVEDENSGDAGNCVFCRILSGDLPSAKVYSDDYVYAFADINPVAPKHILVIPREHVTTLVAAGEKHEPLLGHLMRTGAVVAKNLGLVETGYRLVFNQGADSGQMVDHLHLHVLGGGPLAPLGQQRTES